MKDKEYISLLEKIIESYQQEVKELNGLRSGDLHYIQQLHEVIKRYDALFTMKQSPKEIAGVLHSRFPNLTGPQIISRCALFPDINPRSVRTEYNEIKAPELKHRRGNSQQLLATHPLE